MFIFPCMTIVWCYTNFFMPNKKNSRKNFKLIGWYNNSNHWNCSFRKCFSGNKCRRTISVENRVFWIPRFKTNNSKNAWSAAAAWYYYPKRALLKLRLWWMDFLSTDRLRTLVIWKIPWLLVVDRHWQNKIDFFLGALEWTSLWRWS